MKTIPLARTIYQTCNLKGTFLLRSGKTSNEYFDKYLFESRPDLLDAIAGEMAALVPPGTEVLAGLEMGGIPVAVALSMKTRLPVIFVRKKAKEYGTRKLAEGMDFKGRRVTVVEDVVTTGGAIIDGVKALREQGAVIADVLCVIDRESGGPEKLKELDLRLTSLFTATALRESEKNRKDLI
ncbi:MAG: orotate phosphoribosyltransferase [Elusimicrobia bacterium]|nr:orotate phosphoribosyltransferase [Elusimicrobiota bacterium]